MRTPVGSSSHSVLHEAEHVTLRRARSIPKAAAVVVDDDDRAGAAIKEIVDSRDPWRLLRDRANMAALLRISAPVGFGLCARARTTIRRGRWYASTKA